MIILPESLTADGDQGVGKRPDQHKARKTILKETSSTKHETVICSNYNIIRGK
jgi:hypothetical protein